MIPGDAHHSSTDRTSKWKQATQYVCTSQPRAHSAGFCFSSRPGSPSLSLTGVYQKNQQQQQQNNETAANQQITQMKNQFPDWTRGTIFFPFPQGPIIFQTTVPPLQKNIFTPQSNVRRWHVDAFREKLPELCYWPVTPDWDLNSWSEKLRAASRTTGILRHQERLHLQLVIPEEPSTRPAQKPENTSIAKGQHNFSKLQTSLFLQNEENGETILAVFPPDIQQREITETRLMSMFWNITALTVCRETAHGSFDWTRGEDSESRCFTSPQMPESRRGSFQTNTDTSPKQHNVLAESNFWTFLSRIKLCEKNRSRKKSTCSQQRNEQNSLKVDVQKMFLELL